MGEEAGGSFCSADDLLVFDAEIQVAQKIGHPRNRVHTSQFVFMPPD
jgi:hypothetical protein